MTELCEPESRTFRLKAQVPEACRDSSHTNDVVCTTTKQIECQLMLNH